MKIRLLLLLISITSMLSAQNLPHVSTGKISRIVNFKSQYIASRNIDVWLPDDYSPDKHYSVVYMHDGQMLFDSTLCWNHQEWKVDEIFGRLTLENIIDPCIVVAIPNDGNNRISEYFPDKLFSAVDPQISNPLASKYFNGKTAAGDNYLLFLVKELKPYIDKHFATEPDKDHTFVMGSSMGGLISIYAICEYPDVFGGAACISTAWFSMIEPNYEFPAAVINYLRKQMPTARGHKIYFDYGTGESDHPHELTQSFVDLIAKGKGYSEANYLSKIFDKAQHNESAWRERLHIPVSFLLAKPKFQRPASGKIDIFENFHSKFITTRNIEVWLPKDYSPNKKYAVMYMHDGQMLFDSATTWNKQSWDADDVAAELMRKKKVQDFIIVGIDNGGKTRHTDYFPQKPFESLTPEQKKFVNEQLQIRDFTPVSDNYLRFLVTELKPFIDKKYSVFTDKAHTFVAGSSMGGLISLYAICEYPNIFGGVACLSTHWPGIFSVENNPIPSSFLNYLSKHLPSSTDHKIYFDYGDQTLDALYPPLQQQVDSLMIKKGYQLNSWETHFFPGENHSEMAWHKRLHLPFTFLMKP